MSETFAHGYAVVIGVDQNNIKHLALEAVAKDVKNFYDVLVHPERCAYDPEHVRLRHGPDATAKNIREALMWLKGKVKDDPDSTAVIYYSGHGYRDKKSEEYYLIPYDIQSLARVRDDALKAEEVQAAISEIQARRTLIILDCCHAQGMEVKAIDPDAPQLDSFAFPELPEIKEVPEYDPTGKDISSLADGEGRAILNSSTGAESSYVRADQQMSVFTYHLIEALTGHAPHDDEDTVVYVTDVMSWVTKKVKKTAAAMQKSQTPVMRTSGVFPIAQLIGGQGVALSKGVEAPSPLAPLPKVDTGGGDYAGRDIYKTEGGVHFQGGEVSITGPVIGGGVETLVQGDQFNMSGNFRGAILNIKSNLQNVTQTIGAIPYAQEEEKEQLADLIQKLEAVFEEAMARQDAPAALADDAEKMIKRIQAMIDEANGSKPDEEMIETWGDRVKKQAVEVGKVLPAVLPLASQIVAHVLKMLP